MEKIKLDILNEKNNTLDSWVLSIIKTRHRGKINVHRRRTKGAKAITIYTQCN